jgi:hypothetical protein
MKLALDRALLALMASKGGRMRPAETGNPRR